MTKACNFEFLYVKAHFLNSATVIADYNSAQPELWCKVKRYHMPSFSHVMENQHIPETFTSLSLRRFKFIFWCSTPCNLLKLCSRSGPFFSCAALTCPNSLTVVEHCLEYCTGAFHSDGFRASLWVLLQFSPGGSACSSPYLKAYIWNCHTPLRA